MAITFDQAIKLNRANALRAMEKATLLVEADAKLKCPVDSGTLKRSITHDVIEEKDNIIGVVGTPVEYAFFAEKHQPYLEPAMDQNIQRIKLIFAEELKREK